MANALANTTSIMNKIHAHFAVACNFIPVVRNEYEKNFAIPGGKIGDTLLIKRPNQFKYVTTQNISPTAVSEVTDALVLNTWGQVSELNADKDLVLSIDDKNDQLLIDMSNVMAENVESIHLSNALNGIHWTVGIAGTAPTTQAYYGAARGVLNKTGVPKAERALYLTSDTVTALIGGQATYYNPNAEISKEYRDGDLGPLGGFKRPFENDLMSQITTGTRTGDSTHAAGSPGLTGVASISAFTATTLSFTCTSGWTFNAGETFQINGCYAVVNGLTKTATFQGVISTTTTATGGSAVITLAAPGIVVAGTGISNATISATPVSQTITFFGAASTAYPWSFAMHPKFYTFASVRTTTPEGAMWYGQKDWRGVSFRFWLDRNVTNSTFPLRLDMLSGGVIHPVPNYVPAVRIACAS